MYCIIATRSVLFKLIKRHTLTEGLEALGKNTKVRFITLQLHTRTELHTIVLQNWTANLGPGFARLRQSVMSLLVVAISDHFK